jgi:hypothetical protein
MGFDEPGNFAVLRGNSDDWSARRGNSVDLAWNDQSL